MAFQSHLYRRGASYVWRRRTPARAGGRILQISLRTNEPLIARRRAAIVTVESNNLFDAMSVQGLTVAEARKFLEFIIEREQKKIAIFRADVRHRGDSESNQAQDWAMGTALRMIAQHGAGAAPLTDMQAEALHIEGRSPVEVSLLRENLKNNVSLATSTPQDRHGSQILDQLQTAIGRQDIGAADFLVARNRYIQGRAAAYIQAAKDTTVGFDEALQIAEALANPIAAPVPQITQPAIQPEVVDEYSPVWEDLIARFEEQQRNAKIKALSIEQKVRIYRLFAEATGITDLREIRQVHLAKFVDLLNALPKTYRKSSTEQSMSLAQILKRAKKLPPEEVGLAPSTVKRNLGYLALIFRKAISEGYRDLALLDTKSLKPRETKRARDKRPALQTDDILALFEHPIWRGNLRGKKWQEPGPTVEGDGLYWLPLIAAFTDARRAEIGGLAPNDVGMMFNIPFIRFAPNKVRGVKNLASPRTIAMHPQLVELGLLDRAAKLRVAGADMLFPDLRMPTEDKIGEKIDYKFRLALTKQLVEGRNKKSFHSFRHYVNGRLQKEGIVKELRLDIMGHAGEDTNSEVYSQSIDLITANEIINLLPRIEGVLPPNSHRQSGFDKRDLFSEHGLRPIQVKRDAQPAQATGPRRGRPRKVRA